MCLTRSRCWRLKRGQERRSRGLDRGDTPGKARGGSGTGTHCDIEADMGGTQLREDAGLRRLRPLYMRDVALDGCVLSKRERRWDRGETAHSRSHLALNSFAPASRTAALLTGRGRLKGRMRAVRGVVAPKAASFARASTASLPAIPVCAGTQRMWIFSVGRVHRRRRWRVWKRARRCWPGWGRGEARAMIASWQSVKMSTLVSRGVPRM
ncbi:hypothetical protein DFH08DRAFT_993568, partial [Mycena albidolilacea]